MISTVAAQSHMTSYSRPIMEEHHTAWGFVCFIRQLTQHKSIWQFKTEQQLETGLE